MLATSPAKATHMPWKPSVIMNERTQEYLKKTLPAVDYADLATRRQFAPEYA